MLYESDADEKLLKAMIKYPIIARKNFCLFRSGKIGDDFFDFDRLSCKLELRRILIQRYKEKIDELKNNGVEFNKIAFIDKNTGPTGSIVLASPLSEMLEKDFIILRIRKRLRLPHVKVKGWIKNENDYPIKKGDLILLIDDVTTTGEGSLLKAIQLVKEFQGKIVAIVTALCRDLEAIKQIKENGCEFKYIWTRDKLVNLGLMLPTEEEMLKEDFIHRIVKETKLSPNIETALRENFKKHIISISKENNIDIDEKAMRGLVNMYFTYSTGMLNAIEASIERQKGD